MPSALNARRKKRKGPEIQGPFLFCMSEPQVGIRLAPLPKPCPKSCERILVPDVAPALIPAGLLAMQGR